MMSSVSRLHPSATLSLASGAVRKRLASSAARVKKEGDISSVFVSLSNGPVAELPPRFGTVKRKLIQGNEEKLQSSWRRLLAALKEETNLIKRHGSAIIPSIRYADLHKNDLEFQAELKRRGVAIIRGVVPPDEARSYKDEVEQYVKANPSTKAFPPHDPQVFELYWSPSQVKARSHPNMLSTQRLLMKTWHTKDPDALISTRHPVTYADRLRIRQPGDAGFALGPHVDGGSVERWEETGYGVSGVYDRIWKGEWDKYDPWESSCRLAAQTDLYNGAGACSMFRMFQGWLSMSWTGPGEGTLLVNPMVRLTTAYMLLRPFFTAISPPETDAFGNYTQAYLDEKNWKFEPDITATLQGATPGHSQELNNSLHPHLELAKSMVHIPKIEPGDYVAWHCDAIHAVDSVHRGNFDSSVLYIPVCPLTEANAEYLALQRDAFLQGTPGPDFPGGIGESHHVGRPGVNFMHKLAGEVGMRAMGLAKWVEDGQQLLRGETRMLRKANNILESGSST